MPIAIRLVSSVCLQCFEKGCLCFVEKIVCLSLDLVLLFWCSLAVVFNWSSTSIIIFFKVWFFVFNDHSSGYWFLVQHVLFFSSAWSMAKQLKSLWTVPWITFFNAEAVHWCKNSMLLLCQLILIPRASDIVFAAYTYVDIKKSQISFYVFLRQIADFWVLNCKF